MQAEPAVQYNSRTKRPSNWLEPTEEFQPNVPRLHTTSDIRVVTINGISRGLVRKIGAGVFLWSSDDKEGRTNTEEEAFLKIGFHLYRNSKGQQCLKQVGSRIIAKVDL